MKFQAEVWYEDYGSECCRREVETDSVDEKIAARSLTENFATWVAQDGVNVTDRYFKCKIGNTTYTLEAEVCINAYIVKNGINTQPPTGETK